MTYLFTNKPGPAERSAFGEPISVPLTPVVQLDAIYATDPREAESFLAFSGNIDQHDSHVVTNAGTTWGGYAVIRSRRLLRYRAGQGALCRFTAKFEDPHPNATLRAGLFNQEQALQIGYNGNSFGILRFNEAKAHIAKLELTAAAGTPAETGNLTLNGTSYSIVLGGVGSTADGDATKIANTIINLGTAPWVVEEEGANVYFLSTSTANLPGTFSYTSTGSSAGVVLERQSGNAGVQNWTYQADWNEDKLDGSGPSGMTLNHNKLNIFQVNFRWLGVGRIQWSVEDEYTGDLIPIHTEHYTNNRERPHLDNPSFRVGYVAANLLGPGGNSKVGGSSAMCAIEGVREPVTYTTGIGSGTRTSLVGNTLHHLLSIRNSQIHQGKINLRNTQIKQLSISYNGNDPLEIFLALNDPVTRTGRIGYSEISSHSHTLYSRDATTTVDQQWLAVFNSDAGSVLIPIDLLNLILYPNSRLSVFVRSAQNIQSIICSLTWDEI